MEMYDHKTIEARARAKWEEQNLYHTDLSSEKEPYYLLVEFPYPSGDLHTGHWYAFAVTDIYARIRRARGDNVLFPIGFDAFGLPAENAAIKNGVDPKEWTYKNIERMRAQLISMGPSFDWSKEVITADPSYYQWTQWLFTKLFEHGLAEHREAAVKWCPKDQTVLANEQVVDGKCERCGTEVEEKNLTQWFLKITEYADRLLDGLEKLPWREEIKEAQRAWIGKSEGALIDFPLAEGEERIRVFTTRPDTLYGVTYVVLAPEHPLLRQGFAGHALENQAEVDAYLKTTTAKTERERSENKEKTGIELKGMRAINPATKEEIPIFVADYVLASYGTGAVMAVPAHDERDYEFAQKFSLPVRQVVVPISLDEKNPPRKEAENTKRDIILAIVRNPKTDTYLTLKWKKQPWRGFVTGGVEEGENRVAAARREIAEETGYTDLALVRSLGMTEAHFYAAHKEVNRQTLTENLLFELKSDAQEKRDPEEEAQYDVEWLPFSELVSSELAHAEAPLLLQRIATKNDCYTGQGRLINSGSFSGKESTEAMADIVESVGGERTTNYRLRDWLVSRQRYWGCPIPIVYDPEGKPHAIPAEHLPWELPTDVDFTPTGESPLASSKELRARVTSIFGEGWTPEFDTLDTFVDSSWYFMRYLDTQDVNDFSDQKRMKRWLPVNRYSGGSEHTTMHLLYARFFTKALHDLSLVPVDEPFLERFNRGLIMGPDGQKMSKSKGNVINPDEYVATYGADAVRMYLAFIGPYNEPGSYPWQPEGVAAIRKFLDRTVRLCGAVASREPLEEEERALAQAAAKIATDSDRFKLNTAVSALMVLLNTLEAQKEVSRAALRDYVLLLAPFAPHVAEHLWETLGEKGSVHAERVPTYAAALLAQNEVAVGVQVNGKRRGEVTLSLRATEEEALAAARAVPAIAAHLGADTPTRVVYVPGRILNIVV